MVASTVKSLHFFDPINSSILTFPIQPLVEFISLGVPLFLGGLAQSGRIHALIPANGRHTRLPTHVTFEKGSLCFVGPWHDCPAVAAQFARGADDSSPDSGNGFGPNFWLGTANRPVGCTLGTLPTGLTMGVVWVDGEVSASFWPLAVHVSVATICPCFLRTTHASVVSPSQDFCWPSRSQLTTVLNDGLYLAFPPPITALGPGPEATQGICTHGGDHP